MGRRPFRSVEAWFEIILNFFLVSSRRALHRATSSYDPSTSRRYYSSKVNSKSKKSKCLRGPIGPTGPGGPQGPPGPPGVCPSSCPDSRTFPVKRNLLEKKIEKAAFQIALSNSAYTTLESVVVWDTIITNRGNMFNLSSGIFTASKPGKLFSSSILDRPFSLRSEQGWSLEHPFSIIWDHSFSI